ncbi:MAG: transcription-repair coupling factor [Clostridium sp. 26_22]|nr:MAG: transcription-repair coupling factor [Clostridium sp. 26_22]
MNKIIGELGKSNKFVDLSNQIENKKSPISISGLTDVGMVELLSAINQYNKKPILLITYNEIQAKQILEIIENFEKEKAVLFPKKEIVTYDFVAESKDLPYERIETLNKIKDKKNLIVVTTIEALMQKLPPKEILFKNILEFKVGDIYNLEELKKTLVNLGYSRCEFIEGRGQFSVRGGIVDISINENLGVRIEFWGDEVDSIRNFNITSQRSINTLDKIKIYPAHEFVLDNSIEEICKKITKKLTEEKQEEILEQDIEQIKAGNYISKIDKYFNEFYDKQSTLLEYLNDNYLIILDEISKIEARQRNISQDNSNLMKNLIEKEKIVPEALKNITSIDLNQLENEKSVIYFEKQDIVTNRQAEKYTFNYRQINYYKSEIENLFEDIKRWNKEQKSIYVMVSTKEKAKKLKEILEKEEIACTIDEKLDKTIIVKSTEKIVTITIGKLPNGFENFEINQVVVSADELIEGKKKKTFANKAYKEGEKVVFADLKIGDYVVHKNYGIGIFVGVNTITADGTTKDYIKLKYKNDAILYVPTSQLDSIRKYVGGDAINPPINSLGSKDWIKTKEKVKKNLRAVAKELIELYAKREKAKGYAFSKDTPWQSQFENSFPYQETDDQLRCIEEVKKDMENQRPMDRLLCGDVGYGKTEVAIRAAFKAVMDHKQVAYLVPTTVLAQQQYEEFRDRMAEFPIKVDILNRFKSKKYQDEVVKKLKLGEVDIVIGTHRMLSKDVEFKDIGLLIIDEEHRFGVKAKEKIKEYKSNIDVLTMTATPIPRTMHMSIVGIRDMSVIYEPPHNRKPVQTYVLEYDQEVIKEAITKELERDGQVFYIYNRVDTIQRKADEISRLVPEAKVSYAHGRMSGNQIEEIMQDFIDKKSNVLVCTTILESGIDIANANTIIVENADRMGLAALYQIRGRVGRSDRQAYAYITYRKDKMLSEEADKRLKAIKEFTEFGSGFKIAMRDLEIRGAGSLLGEIQSGHLEQVGYDTYCNLLDEVVKEMQGTEIESDIDIQIDLNVTSYIPDEYIEDSAQKIEIYQNIALCRKEEDIQNVVDEIIDRFGNMPAELENLLDIARIKYLAKPFSISKIASKRTAVVFTFEQSKYEIDLQKLLKTYKNRIKFSPGIKTMITLEIGTTNERQILNDVTEFLKQL